MLPQVNKGKLSYEGTFLCYLSNYDLTLIPTDATFARSLAESLKN